MYDTMLMASNLTSLHLCMCRIIKLKLGASFQKEAVLEGLVVLYTLYTLQLGGIKNSLKYIA
jgi:hypothetical protein